MISNKVKFIVQKQDKKIQPSKNIPNINLEASKLQFFVEKKDNKNNNVLSSANKKVNENANENKTKKFQDKDDSFSLEILDENPNNINNNVYNFDFNLRDKNYELKNYPFSNLIGKINSKYIFYKYLLIIDNCFQYSNLMKYDDYEKIKLDDELNMKDGEKFINDAFENKKKRLLNSLKHEKEMQMKKLEEDAEIQEKRITEYVNFERDNMIKAFKEEKEFNELKKKLKIPNYKISSTNQEGIMEFLRKNVAPNDIANKIEKK